MQRRRFLKTSAGAGFAAFSAASAGGIYGANNRLNVGLIGCGGRGVLVARLMRGTPEDIQAMAPASYREGKMDPRLAAPRNVEINALCDVYGSRMESAKRWTPQARTYSDFRKLLEQKDVDAVIIATPDHWHAPMLILACEAGKDVYLEKPVMYRLREARPMIEAVRKHKRIVMIGTQHRSGGHFAQAAKIVQSGQLGEVKFVRVWNCVLTGGSPPVPDSDPPPDLDWDFWLGPAPKVPFNRARLSYRNFMDYTNGIISDYGNHRFDSVHQIMGKEIPLKVSSSGGRLNRATAGDILDYQLATYEYPDFVVSYEAIMYNGHGVGGRTPGMRYYGMRGEYDRPHGMAFYGTNGTLFVDRIGMEAFPAVTGGRGGRGATDAPVPPAGQKPLERFWMNEDEPTPLHAKNFVDCVRERRDPSPNIETGARATAVSLIGNVAFWTGRKLTWDDKTWTFPGDREAEKYTFRPYRKPWDLVKIV
ncbi:MAG: Gfo/Idh/MocA family protein [Bryobacteraceae bacterium]